MLEEFEEIFSGISPGVMMAMIEERENIGPDEFCLSLIEYDDPKRSDLTGTPGSDMEELMAPAIERMRAWQDDWRDD